jgi:hypothetical protein
MTILNTLALSLVLLVAVLFTVLIFGAGPLAA